MHSTFLEIVSEPMNKSSWTNEEDFLDCCSNYWDYIDKLHDEKREKRLREMIEISWVSKLFTQGERPDIWIYNGKLEEVKTEWYIKLQKHLDELVEKRGLDIYHLKTALETGGLGQTLVCLPEWTGTNPTKIIELLDWLKSFKKGDVFYVNSVYDYHY